MAVVLTPDERRHAAFFQGMTVLLAAVLMSLCWSDFRLPNGSVMIVVASVLPAALVHAANGWRRRFSLLFGIFFCSGLLQFCIGMLKEQKVLVLLVPGAATFCILRYFRHSSAALASIAIGWQALPSAGGFLPAADRWLSLGFSAAATLAATAIVKWFEPGNLPCPVMLKPRMPVRRMLRITVVILIGNFLYLALRIPQGNWIALTSTLIYVGASPRLVLNRLALLRVFATPIGLYCGFLYLSLLTYFNYQFVYLIPPLGALAFYLYYRTGNYILFAAFFMMAMALYTDMSFDAGKALDFRQLYFCRVVNTAIGALLVMLFNRWFLPDASYVPRPAAA